MSDDEGAWKVVEIRCRRPRRATTSKRSQHRRSKTENSANPGNKSAHGGYTYSIAHQRPEPTQEELVKQELQKLEKLKCLLRGTALWGRIVKGLHSALLELGLEADHPRSTDNVPGIQHSQASLNGERYLTTNSIEPTAHSKKHEKTSPEAFAQAVPQARVEEIVCYGIGSFSECHYARYQMALALCLRDLLSSPRDTQRGPPAEANGPKLDKTNGYPESLKTPHVEASSPQSPPPQQQGSGRTRKQKYWTATKECDGSPRTPKPRMVVFDPVMTETDKGILNALGCSIPPNEKGKRCCGVVGEDNSAVGSPRARTRAMPTLFFMPHCPYRLYSNLLWANWSSEGKDEYF